MRQQLGAAMSAGECLTIGGAKPSVGRPFHPVDRRLAPERASPAVSERPPAEKHHVGLTAGSHNEVRMTGALQCRFRAVAGGHDVDIGVQFVGPLE